MKLNCYKSYEEPHIKQLQVVYLAEVKKLAPRKISEFVDYALSTIRNYICKFRDKLAEAKRLFEGLIVSDPYPSKPCAYVLELFNKNDFKWLKVGKAKDLSKRVRQLINEYKEIDHIEVKETFECDTEDDALTMENILRKFYKSKAESSFIPNDRFEGIRYKENELRNNTLIMTQYSLCKETF